MILNAILYAKPDIMSQSKENADFMAFAMQYDRNASAAIAPPKATAVVAKATAVVAGNNYSQLSNTRSADCEMSLVDRIRKSSPSEREAALKELLKLTCTKESAAADESSPQYQSSVSFTAPNGAEVKYFWLPSKPRKSDSSKKEGYKYFNRKMPSEKFQSFLTNCFGSVHLGMSILLDSFVAIDQSSNLLRPLLIQKTLTSSRPIQYSANQCMLIKAHVPLSGRGYERLSQTLQTFDSSTVPLLIDRGKLRKFEIDQFADAVPLKHKKGKIRQYTDKKQNGTRDFKDLNIEYSVKDCFDVVKSMANALRQDKSAYIGIWMGPTLGECVIPYFIFDHGGNSFKAVLTLLLCEGCRTLYSGMVGVGNFTETSDILLHFMMPEINNDARRLSEHFFVSVEWDGAPGNYEFDYMLIHKSEFGNGYDNSTRALPAHILPRYYPCSFCRMFL
jgi:hypothetical protein